MTFLIKKAVIKMLDKISDWACKNYVICGQGTYFRRSANVENIQKDRNQIKIGNNTIIEGELLVFKYGGNILIGDNVYIGTNSKLWSGDSVSIGSDVLISHDVNIVDTNSHELDHLERAAGYKNLTKFGHPKDKSSIITGKVIIEDYVWISFGVTILKNVRIGKGAIVAAGSIVTKDVEPFTTVAGNPAKKVRWINKENTTF